MKVKYVEAVLYKGNMKHIEKSQPREKELNGNFRTEKELFFFFKLNLGRTRGKKYF